VPAKLSWIMLSIEEDGTRTIRANVQADVPDMGPNARAGFDFSMPESVVEVARVKRGVNPDLWDEYDVGAAIEGQKAGLIVFVPVPIVSKPVPVP